MQEPTLRRPTLLLPLLSLLVFALAAWQLAVDGPLRTFDESLSRRYRQQVPVTDGPAELAADLGNFEVALPVLAVAVCLALLRGRAVATVVGCALAMVCVPLLVGPLKLLFDRPGPLGGSGYFPSGHTATAVVAYGGAALLLGAPLRSRGTRWCAWLAALALVVATGAGLVVRGYHWPLDVVASCALGGLLLWTAALGVRWTAPLSGRRDRRRPRASPAPGPPDR
ncbi:phosphatase PAP2 family protein [Streptomyces sp. XM4193]|uniref:phosphatase PAP2 family protein n=1 Tax=Streptomyces sp. XM4193 TaxID=2929782 RepID=UPI001FF97182|nr:phosphatase PAP2 family protein [Streptomyces sp. XM4193]MCK1798862.1 phosphatase PAP2 family protein [Streptomyces sp. XM4193]